MKDINMDMVFLFLVAIFVGYYLCKREDFKEDFSEQDNPEVRRIVRAVYNADVNAIRELADTSRKLQAGGLTHPGDLRVKGNHFATGDMVMNGGNNWLFHTPDDGRRVMYVTPSGTYNQENWNWGASTEHHPNGDIRTGNDLYFRPGRTIRGDGRLHVFGEELLYILNRSGVMIGKEWGGNGNLRVQGNLHVDGGFSLMPRGVIVTWNGHHPPAGWALCNGQNGTPDLRNRFIVGTGGQYGLGATGGADTVTLSVEQIPPHVHSGVQNQHDCRDLRASGKSGCWMAGPMFWRNTDSTGGGKPHENRPPYYALAYIMKL